jgi:transcriptional regulator with PAS, ATPase and Fis domain
MLANPQMNAQFYHKMFQFLPNALLVINKHGIVVFCNEAAAQMLQLSEKRIAGKLIHLVLPGLELADAAKDGQERLGRELYIFGQTYLVDQSPIYEETELAGAVAVFHNITALKQTLVKLEMRGRTLGRYENALNLLSECIIAVDDQGIVTLLSDSYAQFLGIKDPSFAIGKHCTEVVENTRMHIVVQTGQAEIGHIQRVGNQKLIAARIPVFENGKIVGAVGKVMFQDVQELKLLANQIQMIESKLDYYQKELKRIQGAKYSFESIVGNGEKMRELKNLAVKVAKSRSTILITGESGTGKELFAHAIHQASTRSEAPFIRLNCASIPKELFEAELFGYEEGAFTGAKKGGKPGKIELAKNGTLFLDEIGDMPLDMQAKLLRVLQEKEIERVGGTKISQIDVRFIAATHRNLREMVSQGKFREDLFYRLNVFAIEIPPLRDRRDDIFPISRFLIQKLNHELGTNITSFDDQISGLFENYDWPGNIRELENVLERSMNILEGDTIRIQHLPIYLKKWAGKKGENKERSFLLQDEIEMAERRAILRVLEKTGGNKQEAAHLLGIHRASLYRKIEKYGLQGEESLSQTCD